MLFFGATGSLGRAVVKALAESNEKVKAFVRNKEKAGEYFGST
jgi:uncharacterized protein YbjT (DUF2867 family)